MPAVRAYLDSEHHFPLAQLANQLARAPFEDVLIQTHLFQFEQ